jgi:hypothetical protein
LTGALLVTLLRWRPDLVAGLDAQAEGRRPVAFALGLFGLALAVAAFVAPFASALPDGLQKTAESLGFASRARALWPGLTVLGPAVAGVAGTAVAAGLAFVLGRKLAIVNDDAHR